MITTENANKYLDYLVGNKSINYIDNSGIAYVGLGLVSSTPNEDGTNFVEPQQGDYKRALLSYGGEPSKEMDRARFGAATNGKQINTEDIIFPECTSTWGDIGYFGIFNTETPVAGQKPILFGRLLKEDGTPTTVSLNGSPENSLFAIFRKEHFKLSIDRSL